MLRKLIALSLVACSCLAMEGQEPGEVSYIEKNLYIIFYDLKFAIGISELGNPALNEMAVHNDQDYINMQFVNLTSDSEKTIAKEIKNYHFKKIANDHHVREEDEAKLESWIAIAVLEYSRNKTNIDDYLQKLENTAKELIGYNKKDFNTSVALRDRELAEVLRCALVERLGFYAQLVKTAKDLDIAASS